MLCQENIATVRIALEKLKTGIECGAEGVDIRSL
jgi:hypothetical protein